ncbi:MAG: putative Acyl-CoA dehydrogenase [Acidimicrobiales bacterium]|nr:putative Acyl-CoA dehydrogenase [Acidimicrobiales bacterium]
MDFAWPDEIEALRCEALEVGRAAAASLSIREESWVRGFDRDFSRQLGERGWLGMTWPREVGGHERTALERFVVTEALISTGAPLAATWVGDRQIGPTLLANGSPEQIARYLPPMAAGEVTWSLGMSEPDAGSDLASLRTRAVERDGAWVIEGQKVWTSFAAVADHCYLVARTDPDAPPHAGMSEFIVHMDAPGITVAPIRDITGESHFCEVVFDGVVLPRDALVGKENGSWQQLMRQLEHERGGIDRLMSNRALYEDARATADRSNPTAAQEIAAIETMYRIVRLAVIREVIGQAPPGFSAVTKILGTELEQRIAQFVAATAGPAAMLDGRVSRAVVYAPAYTIQGGTSAILRNVIGERLLGLPRR